MFTRLLEMLKKEFIQVLRDPRMKGIVFFAPVFQVVVFGYAITTDVRHVPTAVYDLDNSLESREVVSRFVKSGYFDVAAYVTDDERARELLDRDIVKAILRIDAGFGNAVRGAGAAPLQLILDGTDSNTAGVVLSYGSRIAQAYSSVLLVHRMEAIHGVPPRMPQVTLEARAWFNENLESRNYYVPGTIATLVTLVTVMLASMAVVREKEIGTMEQIIVTPIRPIEFILGKTLPFSLIALLDLLAIMTIAVFWFDVPIRGNPLWLLVSVILYIMTTLGVGLIVSTISRTQQQAMMSTFLFFFPAMLLSGFMFPIANMPVVIQWLTYLDPLRYLLIIVRGIFLKGVGPEILWTQMLPLAIMGPATLLFASLWFRKTLK